MMPYYEHGGITIYHGDCREILPYLPPSDVVITDPPYGTGWVRGKGEFSREFRVALDRTASWDQWNVAWLDVCTAKFFAIFTPFARIGEMQARFPNCKLRVYMKNNPRPPLRGCDAPSLEPILCYPQVRFSRGPQHLLVHNDYCLFHPTQKPLSIMLWLTRDMTAAGESVLDPFMGSGTALVAAKHLGRYAIGIEIEERYCEIAAQRLEQEMLPFPAPPVASLQQGDLWGPP